MSDSELRLLLLLLSLIVVAVSYFFVFQKTQAKAEELETSNEQDAQTVQRLEMMVGQQEEVEKQTEDLNRAVELVIDKYPSEIPQEKAIWVVQDMEDQTGIKVNAINVLMNNAMGDIFAQAETDNTQNAETTEDTTDETTDATDVDSDTADTTTDSEGTAVDMTADSAASAESSIGYYNSLTLSYEADYDSFKRLAEYAENAKDRMTIPAISVAYDETTGLLTGTLTMNLYYLTNTGREYEAPEIDGVGRGVADIFYSGNVSSVKDSQDENGGEEDEDTSE